MREPPIIRKVIEQVIRVFDWVQADCTVARPITRDPLAIWNRDSELEFEP